MAYALEALSDSLLFGYDVIVVRVDCHGDRR